MAVATGIAPSLLALEDPMMLAAMVRILNERE